MAIVFGAFAAGGVIRDFTGGDQFYLKNSPIIQIYKGTAANYLKKKAMAVQRRRISGCIVFMKNFFFPRVMIFITNYINKIHTQKSM